MGVFVVKKFTLPFLVGLLGGILFVTVTNHFMSPNKEHLIKEFYKIEVAAVVSPHGLRKHIKDIGKNIILVDLRSREEYETEHIVGAINIPIEIEEIEKLMAQ